MQKIKRKNDNCINLLKSADPQCWSLKVQSMLQTTIHCSMDLEYQQVGTINLFQKIARKVFFMFISKQMPMGWSYNRDKSAAKCHLSNRGKCLLHADLISIFFFKDYCYKLRFIPFRWSFRFSTDLFPALPISSMFARRGVRSRVLFMPPMHSAQLFAYMNLERLFPQI